MAKFVVYREEPVRGGERSYLAVDDFTLIWLPTSNYPTWDDCKKRATGFSEIEATFAIHLAKLANPLALFTYDVEESA